MTEHNHSKNPPNSNVAKVYSQHAAAIMPFWRKIHTSLQAQKAEQKKCRAHLKIVAPLHFILHILTFNLLSFEDIDLKSKLGQCSITICLTISCSTL